MEDGPSSLEPHLAVFAALVVLFGLHGFGNIKNYHFSYLIATSLETVFFFFNIKVALFVYEDIFQTAILLSGNDRQGWTERKLFNQFNGTLVVRKVRVDTGEMYRKTEFDEC